MSGAFRQTIVVSLACKNHKTRSDHVELFYECRYILINVSFPFLSLSLRILLIVYRNQSISILYSIHALFICGMDLSASFSKQCADLVRKTCRLGAAVRKKSSPVAQPRDSVHNNNIIIVEVYYTSL